MYAQQVFPEQRQSEAARAMKGLDPQDRRLRTAARLASLVNRAVSLILITGALKTFVMVQAPLLLPSVDSNSTLAADGRAATAWTIPALLEEAERLRLVLPPIHSWQELRTIINEWYTCQSILDTTPRLIRVDPSQAIWGH